MASKKNENANRHHGGPGSSHQRDDLPDPVGEADSERRPRKSKVSGGGGESDSHHTHDPRLKGET